jgi:polyisoprenyl-phosphate glycosyltransferase
MNRISVSEDHDLRPVPPRPERSETLVSIVLPVFNEVKVLSTLLGRVRQAISALGLRSEIIFVDDGSTDGSARMLDQMAARSEQVRVIHFSRNFGHQAAVQAGLRFARGHAVVLMDSDLQDAPEAIGRLLDTWRAGYDVVYALRAKRKERAWKRLLFAGFHRLLAAVSTTPIPPDAGNFSLIDARVVREIVALGERDRYLPGLRSWVGFRQTGVVVERLARYDDRPRVSLRGLWRLAKTAIFSFSSLPLTIFYLIGYSALAIFVGLAGYSLYCRLFTDLAIPGWTSYILSASFFGALNALGISMLGEYVLRIYDQVRGRPLYVVDRTVNVANPDASGQTALARLDIDPPTATDEFEQLLTQTAELLDMSAEMKNKSTVIAPGKIAKD